ncbi:MAG: PilZ domain-containing protein [Nitrospinae bacterium]|nr:PilZ domain-containing protein [Nitrospinota bacterium]
METAKPKTKKKGDRQHVRLDISFPMEFTVIEKDEYQLKRKSYLKEKTVDRVETGARPVRVSPHDPVDGSILNKLDPDIAEVWVYQIRMLVSLEKKLDQLLRLMKGPGVDVEKGDWREGVCGNIAGNGMAFFCDERLKSGALLEIMMTLPKLPPISIGVIGIIIKSEAADEAGAKGKYLVAVKFAAINEDDREEIISFVLKRLRERLKLTKKGV